jgi:hypothetical protein
MLRALKTATVGRRQQQQQQAMILLAQHQEQKQQYSLMLGWHLRLGLQLPNSSCKP